MKRLIFATMALAFVFSGCEKEPVPFQGTCTFVSPVPNTWYDETDDWRTTGTTIWDQPDTAVFAGTAELIVDPENTDGESRGKWEMTWEGSMTPSSDGMILVANAEGTGIEGEVNGLKASWTYTMTYDGEWPPNPPNSTFYYVIEGTIE